MKTYRVIALIINCTFCTFCCWRLILSFISGYFVNTTKPKTILVWLECTSAIDFTINGLVTKKQAQGSHWFNIKIFKNIFLTLHILDIAWKCVFILLNLEACLWKYCLTRTLFWWTSVLYAVVMFVNWFYWDTLSLDTNEIIGFCHP